jgi:hypothetical protein
MFCELLSAQSREFVSKIVTFDQVLHALHASLCEIKDPLIVRDQTNANVRVRLEFESA